MGYLPVALGFACRFAQHVGFGGADLKRIELAVEEAVSNVIEHGFERDELANLDIICGRIAGGMEICIRDKGIPWDPTLEEDYQPDADLERQTGRGLGGFLIRRLMDRYEFSNLGRDGKQTRLVKYLDTQPITGDEQEPRTPEVVKPPDLKPEPVAFEIRRMQPREAIEVSRAIFDCYGYSYAGEFVYYPDRLAAMNESGQLLSAVAAVRGTGEIGGHCALILHDFLPAELGVAVTKRKFRGQGFARQLGEYVEDQGRQLSLKGLHVKEVTVHPYTQKFCQKLGFRDCGFLLAHSPKALSFKGIQDRLTQRSSDVLGFKMLHEADPRELYLPQQHAAVIESIYENLGIRMSWQGSNAVPKADQKSVMKASLNSVRSLCEIHLPHCGADAVQVLKQELRRVRREEAQVVELYLNLTNPCTPWLVSEAEEIGFFFTGILPETIGGDSVVMQYFNGIQVEYDALVIDQPKTAELLDYIKAHDPTMV
jgi:serine/threonine-protein kinase RsbW